MNKKHLSIAVLLGLACYAPAGAQQVLATDNALTGCQVRIEGASSSDNPENLFDGDDTTLFHLEDATSASMIFTLREPWYIAGVNFVAGENTDLTPTKISLYGLDESGKWKPLMRNNTKVEINDPYTGDVARCTVTGTAFTTCKVEVTAIKNGTALELSELQLLGIPVTDNAISTAENGSFLMPSSAESQEAVADGDPKTAVTFKRVSGETGLHDAWIQYSFDTPTAIKAYSVTSNTYNNRSQRPTEWELLASEDGETWTTLDIQCNEGMFDTEGYISTRPVGEDQHADIDFAKLADDIHTDLRKNFMKKWGNGQYLVAAWNPDPAKIDYGYNYWWMAHAIDAYIDAYARTGIRQYQTSANSIRTGMYTAYDAGRQDLWNSFYDDMEWMNLACIRGYENFTTGRDKWLEEARQLFDWIWVGWNDDDGGGIRWNSGDGTGKNSCSNAPAIIGAAKLYQLTGEQQYLDKAVMIFDWMVTHSRFDDGFIKDSPHNDNRGWTFSYNQGTWVGGLLELYRITKEQKYYDIAVDLMDKSLFETWFSPDGIMRESGTGDGGMFKGIYIRYITNWVLSGFLDPERQYRYAQYLIENARSLYECALKRPELKIMPDWKHRSDRNEWGDNGGQDGKYFSSNLLSGLFLFESADMLRRAGLTDDNYRVITPAAGKPYRHYRINFIDNNGSSDLQVSGFALYNTVTAGIETPVTDETAHPQVIVENGSIHVAGDADTTVEVFSADGMLLHRATAADAAVALPHGIYMVRTTSVTSSSVTKVAL